MFFLGFGCSWYTSHLLDIFRDCFFFWFGVLGFWDDCEKRSLGFTCNTIVAGLVASKDHKKMPFRGLTAVERLLLQQVHFSFRVWW